MCKIKMNTESWNGEVAGVRPDPTTSRPGIRDVETTSQELSPKQTAMLRLFNHTVLQLNRGNVGTYTDGIMMIHTLVLLLASQDFPEGIVNLPDFIGET